MTLRSVITGASSAWAQMRRSLVHKRAASRWPIAPGRLRATVHDMVAQGTQADGWSPGCEHVASTDDLLLLGTRTVTPNVWQSSFVVSCTKGKSASPVHAGRAFARMDGCTLTQAPAAAMGSSQIPPCDAPALHDRGRKWARQGIQPDQAAMYEKSGSRARHRASARPRPFCIPGVDARRTLDASPRHGTPTVSLAATGCHASPFLDRRRSPLAIGGVATANPVVPRHHGRPTWPMRWRWMMACAPTK